MTTRRQRLFRWGCFLLCAVLLAGGVMGALTLRAGAAEMERVSAQIRPDFTIVIDGTAQEFYNVSGVELHPILYNGTTYLPVRAVGELMGKNVDWNQSTLTVTLEGTRTTPAVTGQPDPSPQAQDVFAQIRPDFTVIVDGVVRTFADAQGVQVYPLLYNGSNYLPLRAIGILMGKTVDWNQATLTVTLNGGSLVTDADSFSGNPQAVPQPTPAVPSAPSASGIGITLDQAKLTALNHAGLTADQVTWLKHELDWDDGREVYELDFCTANGIQYDYEIAVANGTVIKYGPITVPSAPPAPDTGLTLDQAKLTALNHAGLTADQVTWLKHELDWDDGQEVCELEFCTADGTQYDYEIAAANGTVIKYSTKVVPADPAGTASLIGEARAREIALSSVPGATDSHIIKCELDHDHYYGSKYEIGICHNGIEYEIEVDAAAGTVRNFEYEHCSNSYHCGYYSSNHHNGCYSSSHHGGSHHGC